MKTRVISAIVGSAFGLIVLLALPAIFLNVVLAFLSALAMAEILQVMQIRHRAIMALTVLFAAGMPFWMLATTNVPYLVPALCILVYTALFVLVQLLVYPRLSVERMGLVYMMSVLAPLAISGIGYLRWLPNGLFYVFVTLVMAWVADAGAYFIGSFFGKHKLCPAISPKKTVEGLFGGVAAGILGSLLTGGIFALINPLVPVHFGRLTLVALACALLSVVGDLFASVIKRRFDAKDYGKIMPGHGGVMDRFDSLLLMTPLVYMVALAWPLVG